MVSRNGRQNCTAQIQTACVFNCTALPIYTLAEGETETVQPAVFKTQFIYCFKIPGLGYLSLFGITDVQYLKCNWIIHIQVEECIMYIYVRIFSYSYYKSNTSESLQTKSNDRECVSGSWCCRVKVLSGLGFITVHQKVLQNDHDTLVN